MDVAGGPFQMGPSCRMSWRPEWLPGASTGLEMPQANPTRMATEGTSERTGIRPGQAGTTGMRPEGPEDLQERAADQACLVHRESTVCAPLGLRDLLPPKAATVGRVRPSTVVGKKNVED